MSWCCSTPAQRMLAGHDEDRPRTSWCESHVQWRAQPRKRSPGRSTSKCTHRTCRPRPRPGGEPISLYVTVPTNRGWADTPQPHWPRAPLHIDLGQTTPPTVRVPSSFFAHCVRLQRTRCLCSGGPCSAYPLPQPSPYPSIARRPRTTPQPSRAQAAPLLPSSS